MQTPLKALAIWVSILLLAIVNGVLRESVLLPGLGVPSAYLLSGLLLSALILAVTYAALPWLAVTRTAHLWYIGAGWLGLTLVFEFSFGLWQGLSWPALLQAYSFRDGNVWPVVLLVTVCAPVLAAWLRRQ